MIDEHDSSDDAAHSRLPGVRSLGPLNAKANVIDPSDSAPQKETTRFSASIRTLGRLERLAKARFELGTIVKKLEPPHWEDLTSSESEVLLQSVNASSEIEGEHVAARDLPLLFVAATEARIEQADAELASRLTALRSIHSAYVWALTSDRRSFVTFDFLLELHRRMFASSKPDIAGRLKRSAVRIRGAGYDISTLPPSRTEGFLRSLCERTEETLQNAQTHSEASMFLTTAEFILDFLAIHPFEDGNGRTARLMSTYLLERAGYHFARFYPVDRIILENRTAYYEALFRSQKSWYERNEDITPWIDFYVATIFEQFRRVLTKVRDSRAEDPRATRVGGVADSSVERQR